VWGGEQREVPAFMGLSKSIGCKVDLNIMREHFNVFSQILAIIYIYIYTFLLC
jgi:hypothetical protein